MGKMIEFVWREGRGKGRVKEDENLAILMKGLDVRPRVPVVRT